MKKVTLLLLFIGSVSFAQIIEQNQEQRQAVLDAKKSGIYIGFAGLKKPTIFKSSYMILIEERDKLSKRVNITFDFGQESGFFSVDHIVDENGNKIEIFTVVDALNYLKHLGWEYKDTNSIYLEKTYVSRYLMINNGNAVTPIIK